jgi:UPF0755 protein
MDRAGASPGSTRRGRAAGLLLLLIGLGAALLAAALEYRAFTQEPLALPEEGLRYTIVPGTPLKRVAQDLEQHGVLARSHYLVWWARWHGLAARVKAGEYDIESGTTAPQLLEQLVAGRVVQHALTLVEGWTFRQVLGAVFAHPALDHRLAGLSDAEIMERIGRTGEHPEGRFLPDTYRFPRGTTDIAFLSRAYEALEHRLQQEWEGRADGLPYKAPYEALILASIGEKETGRAAKHPEVAGVFVRRLRLGMRLQTDPTVIYGLGDGYEGRLRTRHLRADNPYNTYRIAGLPPTPIAMPGGEAIRAVMHPAAGTALYFVSRGDGSHQFSDTLEEHNRAVTKYILGGRPRRVGGEVRE